MTKTEFHTFIDTELTPRWPRWQPAAVVLDDWWLLLKAYTLEQARSAAREHKMSESAITSEPKLSQVRKILAARRPGDAEPVDIPRFTPWVRCLEARAGHPGWEGREWVRMGGFNNNRCADRRYVTEYAANEAAIAQDTQGGRWCGVVRSDDDGPDDEPQGEAAKRCACEHIRNGPDSPGKHFLRGLRSGQRTMRQAVADMVGSAV